MKECELDYQVWNQRLIALVIEINTNQLGSKGLWALIDYVLIEKVFMWMLSLDWGFLQPKFNHRLPSVGAYLESGDRGVIVLLNSWIGISNSV